MLNSVIVQKLDTGYEMLSGYNRWNAAKLAGIKEIPAIVKTDLSEEEAYVYVIRNQSDAEVIFRFVNIGEGSCIEGKV